MTATGNRAKPYSEQTATAQRTIRLSNVLDAQLLYIQADRRLQGIKCPHINDLIVEAVERFVKAERPSNIA